MLDLHISVQLNLDRCSQARPEACLVVGVSILSNCRSVLTMAGSKSNAFFLCVKVTCEIKFKLEGVGGVGKGRGRKRYRDR